MPKVFFFFSCLFLSVSSAFAGSLPPRNSGKIYLAESSGNWVYLPKTDKNGNENIICLAVARQSPYAVTLRGISGEFGLTITHKNWNFTSGQGHKISLNAHHFHLNKIFYPVDSWTLGTKLSEREKNLLLQVFSKEKNISFKQENNEIFTLSLQGSAKILSLLSKCLKDSHFP